MIYSYRKNVADFDFSVMNEEIEDFCGRNHVPMNKVFTLQLIIEEIATNIIKYGRGESIGGMIGIEIEVREEGIILTISDNSPAFNPLETELPDTDLSAEQRSVGGLGLFLVRQKVKSLNYENKGGLNILRAEI